MLKEIQELAQKFSNVEEVKNELKRVQSVKCRLKKQKARKDYEEEMSKVVNYEQALKEVRDYFEPKKTFVTQMTKSDIQELNYEETMKAIKSIQSKKCNSQWQEDEIDYKKACEIEEWLLEHKKEVKPVEDTVVKKSDLVDLIHHLESQEETIKTEYVIELLQKLVSTEE
jgi:hypothetical protein